MARELDPGEHWYEICVAENGGNSAVRIDRSFSNGRMSGNKIDILPERKHRTIFFPSKNYKKARDWARRKFGNVLYCRKVDASYNLRRIEYLNLRQDTIDILIEKGEFEIGSNFEITPSVTMSVGLDK